MFSAVTFMLYDFLFSSGNLTRKKNQSFQKKTERTLVEKAGLFHLGSFSLQEEKILLRKVAIVVIDGIFKCPFESSLC